eukprot:COSAG06_NODE_28579_length_571_cov_59.540254_2_plen_84_part_01
MAHRRGAQLLSFQLSAASEGQGGQAGFMIVFMITGGVLVGSRTIVCATRLTTWHGDGCRRGHARYGRLVPAVVLRERHERARGI